MNLIPPCSNCSCANICEDECAPWLNYFKRLIRSYSRYGDRSKLMKEATKYYGYKYTKILKSIIDNHYNIKIIHKPSGHFYVFRRNGSIFYDYKDKPMNDFDKMLREAKPFKRSMKEIMRMAG